MERKDNTYLTNDSLKKASRKSLSNVYESDIAVLKTDEDGNLLYSQKHKHVKLCGNTSVVGKYLVIEDNYNH